MHALGPDPRDDGIHAVRMRNGVGLVDLQRLSIVVRDGDAQRLGLAVAQGFGESELDAGSGGEGVRGGVVPQW